MDRSGCALGHAGHWAGLDSSLHGVEPRVSIMES